MMEDKEDALSAFADFIREAEKVCLEDFLNFNNFFLMYVDYDFNPFILIRIMKKSAFMKRTESSVNIENIERLSV